MPKLEKTIVFAQEELVKGWRYYLYRSPDEDTDSRGRRRIGGVYILQSEIGKDPQRK